MLRRLLTLLSAVSLVLCVATCVLWVWSYRARPPGLESSDTSSAQQSDWRIWWVRAEDGHFRFQQTHLTLDGGYLTRPEPNAILGFAATTFPRDANMPYYSGNTNPSWYPRCYVQIPLWSVVVLTAVTPTVWARRRLRARRQERLSAANRCPVRAYDLRATPGRCPECGAGLGFRPAH